MSSDEKRTLHHLLAVGLVIVGTLILVAIGAFVTIAVGFRQSFTSSPPPDIVGGMALLSPFVVFALLLIGYGRRLLRKE